MSNAPVPAILCLWDSVPSSALPTPQKMTFCREDLGDEIGLFVPGTTESCGWLPGSLCWLCLSTSANNLAAQQFASGYIWHKTPFKTALKQSSVHLDCKKGRHVLLNGRWNKDWQRFDKKTIVSLAVWLILVWKYLLTQVWLPCFIPCCFRSCSLWFVCWLFQIHFRKFAVCLCYNFSGEMCSLFLDNSA